MKTNFGKYSLRLVAILLLGLTPLSAQSWAEGWYLEGFGGFSALSDTSFDDGSVTDAEFSGGTLFGAGLGYAFNSNWALETEFFYRTNDADTLSGGNYNGVSESDFASTNLMLNAIYTFTKDNGQPLWGQISPFIGVGVGFLQEVDVDFTVDGEERSFSDSWVPTAQLLGGVEYFWDSNWSLFLEGRYQIAGSVEMEDETGTAPMITADYDTLSFLTGIRFRF